MLQSDCQNNNIAFNSNNNKKKSYPCDDDTNDESRGRRCLRMMSVAVRRNHCSDAVEIR